MNLPNLITLGRLLSVPVTLWLILAGELTAAFWLFVAAGVSDAVDGAIAKTFDMTTDLGRLLDPIADKALLVGIYAALGQRGDLPVWLVILVISRDILLVGGTILTMALERPIDIAPVAISKVNTALQIGLAALVLGGHAFALDVGAWSEGGALAVGVTTALSGGVYLRGWFAAMNGDAA
ncbi:MAG: CDP-alcohol phosphatidyltransferase family protein [Alphaproteobacteria bacterium]|nr:CDP-alcohol phosphatidyltransferase family protein [Alphaproteobacteria bacterium]